MEYICTMQYASIELNDRLPPWWCWNSPGMPNSQVWVKPRPHQTGHEVVPVPWPITDWDVQAGQQLAEVDQLTMPSSKQGLA